MTQPLNPAPRTPSPVFIRPTVGRVVHYFPARGDAEIVATCGPLAAVIAKVWDDGMVNLMVADPNGQPRGRTSVRLIHSDDEPRAEGQAYCKWMDYQKGQAAKTEQLQQQLQENQPSMRFRPNPTNPPIPPTPNIGELLVSHFAPAPRIYVGEHTLIDVLDEPGPGGAYHEYLIHVNGGLASDESLTCRITFQKGGVAEIGRNGIHIEDLLRVAQHRLECFEQGPFPCLENKAALRCVAQALWWLAVRTDKRKLAGVEGKAMAIPLPPPTQPSIIRYADAEITFDDLVRHGIDSGASLTNGMPWSFDWKDCRVTHENDACYLVGNRAGDVHFTRRQKLLYRDGACCVVELDLDTATAAVADPNLPPT